MSTRPLRADAARNRARVLAAAQEAFAAEGLAVPLDDIARRAGVGAGTVYRHFPTKEALFEAVILDRLTRFVEHARSLATAGDAGAAFFDFLRLLITGAQSSKDLADALAGTGLAAPGLITSAKQALYEAGQTLLERAQQAGGVRDDVDIAAVMALFTGATTALLQRPDDPALHQMVFAVLHDGLQPPVAD
ncbi:helix-turn-helix domain-containing protein [Actinophytocola sp.]|uniref:TetR/AcrR family transcriptional regulator n=1 Tax=Actinophytocola sp. TaxID=1872138 RepID=UPI002D8067BF|nr:helix-turn-helix domain-containing protein [Actinophytocola sp.]HET9140925.1 helix-turn-helix domain-containing protein [Actinophytocola sp.]